MNSFFAASLFDNPWVVIVIVIGGALANWLSKQRAKKQADLRPEGEEPSVPSGEFNLEETLRRLMGEEPPAPAPAPPPIPRAAQGELPPVPDWEEGEEGPFQPVTRTVPTLRPPPTTVAQASDTMTADDEQQELAARRFEQLNEQGRHPATVVGHGRGYRSPVGNRAALRWRDPRSARRAFVASLVFAPPKGLEP